MASVPKNLSDGRVHASRVQGPRRVLKELRRLLIKTTRARLARAVTDAEVTWCNRTIDRLTALIEEGDQVLPGGEDPRDRRRARKRPLITEER